MYYVTRWHMQCAYDVLATTHRSVLAVAEEYGYQAEASFRKALKQHMGIGPGAVRRDSRAGHASPVI